MLISKMLVLLNHSLTDEQVDEAKNRLKVEEIIEPPEGLKRFWGQMPVAEEEKQEVVKKFIYWIKENSSPLDYVLVQGEFGSTFLIVDFCLKNSLVPLYAVSERKAEEAKNLDGSVEKKIVFKHRGFRKYKYWN
ncbi:MAG: CRISPR-associated protein Csx20 [Brevinematia bacterium]